MLLTKTHLYLGLIASGFLALSLAVGNGILRLESLEIKGGCVCRRLEVRAPIQVHRGELFRGTQPCASGLAREGKMNPDAGQLMAFKSTLEWLLCGFFFVRENGTHFHVM